MRNNFQKLLWDTLGFCILDTIYVSYAFSGTPKNRNMDVVRVLNPLPLCQSRRNSDLSSLEDVQSRLWTSILRVFCLWQTQCLHFGKLSRHFCEATVQDRSTPIEQFGWFITHWKDTTAAGFRSLQSENEMLTGDVQHTQVICSLSTWENGTLTVTDSMQTMAMDLRSSWIYIDLRPLRKLKQEKEEAEKDLREAFNIQCLSWSHFLQPVQERQYTRRCAGFCSISHQL